MQRYSNKTKEKMKLIFGRDDRIGGNLGDELNAFIWPSLFKNAYSCNNDGIAFLGIGSILSPDPTYNWWMKESTKNHIWHRS